MPRRRWLSLNIQVVVLKICIRKSKTKFKPGADFVLLEVTIIHENAFAVWDGSDCTSSGCDNLCRVVRYTLAYGVGQSSTRVVLAPQNVDKG